MTNEKSKSETSDEELLRIAKERFKLAAEAEAQNRIDEIDDQKFMVGDQWPDKIRKQREEDSRPCLTINRIPQFVRQITNDQRQNRPSIKINPVDSDADIDTAKILQGIVRHIEYNSHADIAYDTAFESAVKSGLGYYRLVTEYSDPMSFQQEAKIKRIPDRFSVYLDCFHQEPDGSDSGWGFVFDRMSEDEFKVEFPNSKLASMSDWESLGEGSDWVKKGSVRVAEYYDITHERVDIVLLSDQSVIEKSKLPETLPEGIHIVRERTASLPKVKWYKINGPEILERTDIPGKWVPIIPVVGDEQILDGRKILSGIIRQAKDPQRMYNYHASAATEMIALAPKAPFIGLEGQFEGYEEKWATANTKSHAYLEYKGKSLNGQAAPPPQRTQFEPQVQAITNERAQSSEELKATTGIYDPSLGNKSNETSGVAIQRRNIQSQTSNFHFIDNLSRSLRHTGRILLAWIPKVYDTPQTVRIIGESGDVEMVKINQIFQEGGKDKAYFLDEGTYDVTVDTGPSFQTKRQEAVASMIDMSRVAPQAMAMAMDLLVKNMDWPGAQEIAERIKKTLPPNIVDDKKDQQPLPPQVQQQMTQMSQMVHTLADQNDEYKKVLEGKHLELASRERIAALQAETQLKIELMKHDSKDGQIAFQEEMREIQHLRDSLNQNQTIGSEPGGGPAPAADQDQSQFSQQPTGGNPPGQSMGDQP